MNIERYPLIVWSESGYGMEIYLPDWFNKDWAAKVFADSYFRRSIINRADKVAKEFFQPKGSSAAIVELSWNERTGLNNTKFSPGQCCCMGIERSTLLIDQPTSIYTHNIDTLEQALILREVWMDYINGLESLHNPE